MREAVFSIVSLSLLMKSSIRPILIATSTSLLLITLCSGATGSADELMAKGKVFEKKFQATEALPLYLEAEKLEPKNPDVLVHIARIYRFEMSDASAKQEKLRLGYLALDYSNR